MAFDLIIPFCIIIEYFTRFFLLSLKNLQHLILNSGNQVIKSKRSSKLVNLNFQISENIINSSRTNMFSQNSSIEEGFNFPQTSKQLAFSNRPGFPKLKRKIKEGKEGQNIYEDMETQKTQTKSQNKLYFKIQVIKKVGTFLQYLKAGIVLSKPNLKQTELYYLQSETKLSQKQNLIPHENIGVIMLQALVFITLWISVWQSSYELIFSKLLEYPLIEICSLAIYLVYIYFFLNTELKNEKLQLISNREIILEYYVNERLVCDIFIIITLILQITPLDEYKPLFIIFRLSTILVLKPLNDITKKLENIISMSADAQIILSILSLFFKICLLLHTLSLVFTTLSNIEKSRGIQITWVEGNNLNITSEMEQYVVGWYWGATVLSTVGFGDITPVNHIQRFFFSFIEVMCCAIFGFFVNYIGSLINMVGQSKKLYEKDMRKLNRYLLKQYLPDTLKSNIRSHFFNKHKIEEVYDPSSEQTIMNKLTINLTSQITQTRNKRILMMSKFIRPFTQQTIRKLSLVAKKMVFAPEQIIFSQKSKQLKLWILQDGVVQEIPTFFNSKQDKPVTVYDKNNQKTLGWINFLTDKPYKTMARAKTFTLSYEIKQEDFYKIMRESQIDHNKMHELKQTLIQNKRLYINNCLSCQKLSHNVIECPRIHFKSRGIYKILIQEKKEQFLKGHQNRKKNSNRSKARFNWKSFQSFSEYTPQIQGIVVKYNLTPKFNDDITRRCSVQSFVHTLYRNKSSQQDKNTDKRSSQVIQTNMVKNQTKIDNSELTIQVNQIPSQKITITNYIDKLYMGQGCGYLDHHNFYKISKKYILYMINLCTNRNRI